MPQQDFDKLPTLLNDNKHGHFMKFVPELSLEAKVNLPLTS